MSKISWADYEPRRSVRQTSRPVRYVVEDDDEEDETRTRSANGKKPRRIAQSSDDDDHGESSDISIEADDNDSEEMDDSSDDVKVRKKAPVSRPSRRKASYVESSDDEEEQIDNDEDSENDEDDQDEDGETDFPKKKKQNRPDDIESLFEEPLEPSIEKIVSSKVDASGVKLYEVKWKGRAYIHNSWQPESDLMEYKGFRILLNYIKYEKANKEMAQHVSDEQLEQMNVTQEMALQKRKAYMIPERILTTRMDVSGVNNEYLVKWTDLPYDCCSWEKAEDLVSSQFLIDSYLERTRSSGKSFAKSHGSSKGVFRKFESQPEWMAASGSLRDYQLEGLNWLRFSHFEKRNVILADEMGLGKTIQCISFLGSLHADLGIPGPYLVVVPLSTISAWKREFAKWATWMNVIEYRGNVQARAVCRQYEWGSGSKPLFNVLLTNYEVANKDFQYLSQYTWSYLLVDEAHRLKDDQSLLYQTLKSIRSSHRLLITGTPLQNSVKELWCLLHFLDPQKFKDLAEFQYMYGEISESTASVRGLSRLHDLLKPYLLRRTKVDVLKSLPSKTERILRIDLSDMQKRYYRWVLTKNFNELNKGLKGGSMSSLSNTIVELKKVANHPYLFDNAELSHHENVQQELTRMVSNSGKMVLLDRLLDRLFETGHRVLIFSQMVRMLDILADYMVLKGFKFQRLDGGMSSEDRQHAMDHFNAEGSPDFVFLLSTRAGGLGVNLATADTVIIFDSDWNPQNDLQAEARAHRIGQTKTVNIYRFVTKGTVEEDILERAKRKMILDHLVIQKMDTSGRGALSTHKTGNKAQFDKAELMRIVEFGAKQLFDESEDTNLEDNPNSTAAATAAAFDLDEILARAETTTDRDQVDQTDEFLSAFKFADFVSSTPNQEVIVKTNAPQAGNEDGSFWEKVIPAHLRPAKNCDVPESAELIYPRRAKMGKVFEEPEDDEANNQTAKAPTRRRGPKTKTHPKSSSKGKGDGSREIKLAVKAIMQFGDDPKAASAFPGDHARNMQLIRNIVDECNAAQKDSVAIDGIDIDAASLKARIEDMIILKKRVEAVDSPYERFRVTAQVQSVRWKCNWGVRQDSMLLLGAYLFGVGAWNEILSDKHLGLGDIVVKPNSDERIVGNSQLSSRLQALLRAIRSQDQKARSSVSRPTKRKSPDSERSPSQRSTKVQVPKSPVKVKESPEDDAKISDWCLTTMKECKTVVKTLKKLKSIHREAGLGSDPRNVVKYLFKVGDFITRTGNEDRCSFATPQQVEHHLWKLSAPFLNATPDSLSALYWDLAAEPNAVSKQEGILKRFEEDSRNR